MSTPGIVVTGERNYVAHTLNIHLFQTSAQGIVSRAKAVLGMLSTFVLGICLDVTTHPVALACTIAGVGLSIAFVLTGATKGGQQEQSDLEGHLQDSDRPIETTRASLDLAGYGESQH